MLPLPDSLIWGALALAVLLCLARQRLPGFIMLAVALLAALGLGHLSPIALLASAAGLLLAWRTPSLPQPWRAVALGAVLLWAVALMLHLIPGFTNLKVLDQVQAGPASVPFNMYLNLDKPLVFFGLLLAWPALLGPGGAVQWRRLALLLVPLAALLVAAWQLGPSSPRWACPTGGGCLPSTTCCSPAWRKRRCFAASCSRIAAHSRRWLGVLVASLLFGAAHLAGGPLLVLFAALAGPAMAWRSC